MWKLKHEKWIKTKIIGIIHINESEVFIVQMIS